ncbi:MAG: TonB-dependent receptor [Opitutus sp.]|nr:TonB-dependent receptor [Opitutus sp.]
MKQTRSRRVRRLAALALECAPLLFAVAVSAQTPTTTAPAASGAIEGRVFNAATGSALSSAQVSVEGAGISAVTDESGSYRLTGVPAGAARIRVSYLGLDSATASVAVQAGAVTVREFELTRGSDGRKTADGEVVRLKEFNVVADREMNAQAVAMNEQRHAPNIKNVVAIDEYGDQGDETIMNFLRFLPSVSIADDALGAGSVSLRGFPANNTGVTVDGGEFASARTASTRTVVLIEVPMSNISRVEVTKVPTPDMPASGLGGSINLISKRGFESKRRVFSYQISTQFHNLTGLRFDPARPNHIPQTSPKHLQPSFNFSYLHPVNKSLAFTVGGARTWRLKEMLTGDNADETSAWNLVSLVQTSSTWQNLAQMLRTTSGNVGFDWRITPKNTLGASLQYRETSNTTTRSHFLANYGAGSTGDATFTQGAATGVGLVRQGTDAAVLRLNTNRHLTLKYGHTGDIWRMDVTGSRSKAVGPLSDIDRGVFRSTLASITNLVLRGDGIPASGGNLPTRYTATTRTGAAVDVYDGRNYAIDTAESQQLYVENIQSSVRADITRESFGSLPLVVKAGLAFRQDEKDSLRFDKSWAFRPNGASDVNARLARNFDVFDEAFNTSAPTLYGRPVGWISSRKVYDLYRQHPEWFVLNETTAYQTSVNNSRRFIETISAAYVRGDLRLLSNRLWLVAGVRFEKTGVEGWGPLSNPSAEYQRNANGEFIRNAAGQRILITTDALARLKLRLRERAAHSENDYDGYYPSLNATYNISDNLLLRAAYARTIGRPEVSVITPGTTITEPDVADPTITVSNTALKPWTADSYDLSLESYFIKGGFGSIGVFQKNIANFFGSLRTDATPELLEFYGLANDPALLGYEISTRTNAGSAKITGVEFNYRQSLTFLPAWAQGLQIFANATKMKLSGTSTADFSGFNPSSIAGGINLVRSRYYVKISCSHQGDTRRGLVAPSATVPAETYNYLGARTQVGISAQYSLSRRFAIFLAASDLKGGEARALRYAPGTPEYAKPTRVQENGYYTTFGIKGEF